MKQIKKQQNSALRYSVKIAVLAAISVIIMLFEFPLPFAPGFYKLDLSETVVLLGGFALGPAAGVLIELIKILLNLIINNTDTAFVGEFANFVIGCSLVLPATLIYKYKKSIKGAIIGLVVGCITLASVGGLMNYFVLIPAYSKFYGLPLDTILSAAKAVNPLASDLKTMILFAVVPFNFVKGVACSLLSMLLYKRLSKILHY